MILSKDLVIKQLKELQNSNDTEEAHYKADAILCTLLVELGYKDIINEYTKVPKWFA